MPVGTAGAVKAVTRARPRGAGRADHPRQHLPPDAAAGRRAGGASSAACTASRAGRGPFLTDSGGYQVFSLTDAAQARRGGRALPEPPRRRAHLLTPERSMEVQMNLGADIAMAFDECPPWPAPREAVEEATARTTRWARRSRDAHTPRRPVALRHRAGRRPPRPARAERARDRRARLPRLRDRRALGGRAQGGHASACSSTSTRSCPRTSRAT